MVKDLSPLVIEALFWKAVSEKPINIEYANDVPGSGFGEPEGSFQYFYRQRRRRKRTFNRNSGGSCDRKKYQVNNTSNSGENKGVSTKNSSNSFRETSRVSISLPTIFSNQASGCSRQKSSNAANEMEGTAGWKLSNSPWNLQVIARSPGSLTRFMPDDIPGVTSPLVYIGMLFSWFAWHVEDHELHSLNFLHTGSPTTWYAVPGDYAFSFEEVIRNQAYGGNIDRLASLTLLGEKTTLLSPEVVVKSGIPCCRLIQNPGEFVATFPRAYHVGFSHGFNCGEAANFGTSKWLKVAKEAVVRRAAMNYLPMLSHQQLLYLLTMSFVSRVPRSLMPGARKSRLRDCQKEERELSVKKAFLENILSENNLLTILLGKNSSYHAVLWDLESLPSPSKESERCIATVVTTPREDVCSENKNIETTDDLYVNDADFSCDFEVDSRTLACVACGILGFPFMCVVKPSERVSMSLLQDVGVSKPLGRHSHPVLHDMIEGFISDGMKDKIEQNESNVLHHQNGAFSSAKSIKSTACSSEDLSSVPDLFPPPGDLPVSLEVEFDKGWSATRGFLRPRIICLEHAIQIEEMLRSKGGANFFVICHSDFQKMKAHAAVIAEDIGSPFGYNEIPLDNASQEGLNLIDLAIDDEEHDECGEDWTSKLSINLWHCVKVRKNSPSEQVQHALALGGLFSDTCPNSSTFNLKWPFRNRKEWWLEYRGSKWPELLENHSVHMKPSGSIQMEKDEVWGAESDGIMVRREGELIQYSRRFKSKPGDSAAASKIFEHPAKHMHNEVSVTNSGGPDESNKNNEKNHAEKPAGSLSIAVESTENFEIQRGNQITEEISMKYVACADASEGQCNIQSDGDVLMKEAPNLVNTMNTDEMLSSLENCSSHDKIELENTGFTMVCPRSTAQNGRKRRIDVELQTEDQLDFNCFIKSPCERLRPRAAKDAKISGIDSNSMFEDKPAVKSVRKSSNDFLSRKNKKKNENVKGSHRCDLEGCLMKFQTKADLLLHKRNQCPHKGCGKKFSSHKYAVIHQRVHDDDRPLKCLWKGCTMTFK